MMREFIGIFQGLSHHLGDICAFNNTPASANSIEFYSTHYT